MSTFVDTWTEIQPTEIELGKLVRIERNLQNGEIMLRIEGEVCEVNKKTDGANTAVSVKFWGWGYASEQIVASDRVYLIGAVIHHN